MAQNVKTRIANESFFAYLSMTLFTVLRKFFYHVSVFIIYLEIYLFWKVLSDYISQLHHFKTELKYIFGIP